jgi:hypothetical protein
MKKKSVKKKAVAKKPTPPKSKRESPPEIVTSSVKRDLFSRVAKLSDAQISKMEAGEIGPLLLEVENDLTLRRDQLQKLDVIGTKLSDRFSEIGRRWENSFGNVAGVTKRKNAGTKEKAEPLTVADFIKHLKISVARSFNHGVKDLSNWTVVRDKAMTNVLDKLKEKIEEAESLDVPAPGEMIAYAQDGEIPPEILAYIDEGRPSYEARLAAVKDGRAKSKSAEGEQPELFVEEGTGAQEPEVTTAAGKPN